MSEREQLKQAICKLESEGRREDALILLAQLDEMDKLAQGARLRDAAGRDVSNSPVLPDSSIEERV